MDTWFRYKSHLWFVLSSFLGFFILTFPVRAQKQDLTFSLGGIASQTRGFSSPVTGQVNISSDKSFGITYGYRFLHAGIADLLGELEFAAMPNRGLSSTNAVVPHDYASLYLAPGIRVKLFPRSRWSPWGAIGGGYAQYSQSSKFSDGQPITNRNLNRGVLDFGGGIDFKVFRFLGLRAEVRDFYSGNPEVHVRLNSSAQHNVVPSGGILFRF